MAFEVHSSTEVSSTAPRAGTTAIGVPMVAGASGPEALRLVGGTPVEPPIDPWFFEQRDFRAKPGQALAAPSPQGSMIVALGFGEREALRGEDTRRAGAAFIRAARGARTGVIDLRGASERARTTDEEVAQAVVEGATLGAYRFTQFKDDHSADSRVESIILVGERPDAVQKGAERGRRIAAAVAWARDLINEPAASMTPIRLADEAEALAKRDGLSVSVLDETGILEESLGGLAGVARGSSQPPRLIRLEYNPPPGGHQAIEEARVPTVVIVGKGITFDSGGLSLKSADGMVAQKTDMSGAAAVLATMSVLPGLDVAVRVLGIVPATENMPGSSAVKPGDVLRARNGKTIEVLNTDAEGRLILADALSLAAEERPDAIVDLATLTGACVVALGRRIAGLMGNDDRLVGLVRSASERAGEATWHLPLPEEYRAHIDSDVADMKNTGLPNQAGALAAGLLLSEFVDGVPWAHLDIAGPARSDADEGYQQKGATGFGVRTLVELISGFEGLQP